MKKPLNIIQTLCKIGQILSIIVFVCCIIGAVGCLIGTVSVAIVEKMVVDGKTIGERIESESGVNLATLYSQMICSMVCCGTGIALAKITELFFKRELELGQPFEMELAIKLRNLSIATMACGLATAIVNGTIIGIISAVRNQKVVNGDMFSGPNIGVGLSLLVLALLLWYGAERVKESKPASAQENTDNAQEAEVVDK